MAMSILFTMKIHHLLDVVYSLTTRLCALFFITFCVVSVAWVRDQNNTQCCSNTALEKTPYATTVACEFGASVGRSQATLGMTFGIVCVIAAYLLCLFDLIIATQEHGAFKAWWKKHRMGKEKYIFELIRNVLFGISVLFFGFFYGATIGKYKLPKSDILVSTTWNKDAHWGFFPFARSCNAAQSTEAFMSVSLGFMGALIMETVARKFFNGFRHAVPRGKTSDRVRLMSPGDEMD